MYIIYSVKNYHELIQDFLNNYEMLSCRMSLQIHILHSYLNFFPQNPGAITDEQDERFHQNIQSKE